MGWCCLLLPKLYRILTLYFERGCKVRTCESYISNNIQVQIFYTPLVRVTLGLIDLLTYLFSFNLFFYHGRDIHDFPMGSFGTYLLVDVRWETDPYVRSRVASVLLYLLRWVDYIDARWVTTGLCGRRFIASLLAGLDRIHALAIEDDNIWKFHLNGFTKATPSVRSYLAIAAFAAYPCEALLEEFLEDDRLLRRVEYFKDVLNQEFQFLLSLPMCIFGIAWQT